MAEQAGRPNLHIPQEITLPGINKKVPTWVLLAAVGGVLAWLVLGRRSGSSGNNAISQSEAEDVYAPPQADDLAAPDQIELPDLSAPAPASVEVPYGEESAALGELQAQQAAADFENYGSYGLPETSVSDFSYSTPDLSSPSEPFYDPGYSAPYEPEYSEPGAPSYPNYPGSNYPGPGSGPSTQPVKKPGLIKSPISSGNASISRGITPGKGVKQPYRGPSTMPVKKPGLIKSPISSGNVSISRGITPGSGAKQPYRPPARTQPYVPPSIKKGSSGNASVKAGITGPSAIKQPYKPPATQPSRSPSTQPFLPKLGGILPNFPGFRRPGTTPVKKKTYVRKPLPSFSGVYNIKKPGAL